MSSKDNDKNASEKKEDNDIIIHVYTDEQGNMIKFKTKDDREHMGINLQHTDLYCHESFDNESS